MIRIEPRKAPPPLPRRGAPTLAALPLATHAAADAGSAATLVCARLGLMTAGEAA